MTQGDNSSWLIICSLHVEQIPSAEVCSDTNCKQNK